MSQRGSRNYHCPVSVNAVAKDDQSQLEALKGAEQELVLPNNITSIITSSLNIEQVYESFVDEMRKVVDVDRAGGVSRNNYLVKPCQLRGANFLGDLLHPTAAVRM